jgi:6-phosphogluconolactonase (cycloisomerase 2 family)
MVTASPQVVVVSGDKIYSFLGERNTGLLTPASDSPLSLTSGLPKQCTADPSNNFLMVTDDTNTLSSFGIDPQTASVKLVSTVSTGGIPVAMAEVGGKIIYVDTQDKDVAGFRLDSTSGLLTPLGVIQRNNPIWIGTAAHPNGQFLYVADDWERLLGYRIDQNTAALTEVYNSGGGEQFAKRPIALTPDGGYLLVSRLHVSPTLAFRLGEFYALGATTGELVGGRSASIGRGLPNFFVAHPNGKFIYAITATIINDKFTGNSELTVFDGLDSPNFMQIVEEVSIPSPPIALALDRSGSFLYVLSTADASTSGSADVLTTYQVDGATGMLYQVGAPYPVPVAAACLLTR